MKILILKPSSLGDVVQALPVLRLLKRHLPQSEIHWWVQTGLAPLLEGDPDLAGVLRFNRRRWAEPGQGLSLWRGLIWTREQRFDWVIDLQCLARSSIFAWLANGVFTVGLDEPREGARGFYDVIVPRPSFHTHAVDWYVGVLPHLGVPTTGTFEWMPTRLAVSAELRKKWPVDERPWLLLQPGARWPTKRWPAESFCALARLLLDAYPKHGIAVLGGKSDTQLGAAIAGAGSGRVLDLTGRLSLPEMVEWIRAGKLMITNDTGPMHVAAALKTPVVALFGPTEPRRTGPYGQLDHVLQLQLPCVPCLKSSCHYGKPFECLRALSATTVFGAVERRLTALQRDS